MSDNPFEVLKLPPTATPEEIVRQGERLCQRTADEATRDAVRQAVRELTESDDTRRLHALLTHPNPSYGSAELDRLIAAHRRPPQSDTPQAVPPLDLEEFRELLLGMLVGEVPTSLPLRQTEVSEPTDEIERQTAEALWQSLIGQPRG